MTDFSIIDLRSQADAVWNCIGEWTNQEILAWLSQRGTITLYRSHLDLYWFRSRFGIETAFRLTAKGEFSIYLGDHNLHQIGNSQ